MRARGRNSDLKPLAIRHIEEFEENPPFEIFLRSKGKPGVSAWHQEQLDGLLGEGKIFAAIEEGMRELEASGKWCGYDVKDAENHPDIKKNGIIGYLCLAASSWTKFSGKSFSRFGRRRI